MIAEKKQFEFIVFVAMLGISYLAVWLAKNKRVPELKILPCIDSLEEGVGRAAEMGKPVWYGTGMYGLAGEYTAMNICGIGIMGRVAELCGKYGVWLQYMANEPNILPAARDLIKQGYQKGGRPEMYNDEMGMFVGGGQMNLIRVSYAYVQRERPGAVFMFGALLSECGSTLAWARKIGTMIFAGTPRLYYQAHLVLLCDYQLLGEELYVGAAKISNDPFQLGTIEGQDWMKLLVIFLIFVGIFAVNLKLFNFAGLLGW
jgi:hypothetical protein